MHSIDNLILQLLLALMCSEEGRLLHQGATKEASFKADTEQA